MARRHGISRSLLTVWRRQYRNGGLGSEPSQVFIPLTLPAEAPTARTPLLLNPEAKGEIGTGVGSWFRPTWSRRRCLGCCLCWNGHDCVSSRREGLDRGRCHGHATHGPKGGMTTLSLQVQQGIGRDPYLAMIAFKKFGQHQPLNRQAERYAQGVWSSVSRPLVPLGPTSSVR